MIRVIAAALLALSFAAASDAKAEVAGPAMTQLKAAKPSSADIKQARVETNGAKTFIINGRRVLVPADSNAEAVIKALKARYPSLQADAREVRGPVTAIDGK